MNRTNYNVFLSNFKNVIINNVDSDFLNYGKALVGLINRLKEAFLDEDYVVFLAFAENIKDQSDFELFINMLEQRIIEENNLVKNSEIRLQSARGFINYFNLVLFIVFGAMMLLLYFVNN